MQVQVITPFLDKEHNLIRRNEGETYDERLKRARLLARLGFVVLIYKDKKKNGS